MNEDNALQELKDSIQKLAEAETKNFAELVKVTGLDLKQDFAEADLSEIDLSGIDFSNANLSGANLSHAKLERAILFNANLENADLNNANLRSANLKGANLINTNLKNTNLVNADLRAANFINADPIGVYVMTRKQTRRIGANLNHADVKNTRFGSNPGIPQLIRQNLEERGAIFEDSPNKPAYAVKS